MSIRLATVLDLAKNATDVLGPYVGCPRQHSLVPKIAADLAPVIGCKESPLVFMLEPYFQEPDEIFDLTDRKLVSLRSAYYANRLKDGVFITKWTSFLPEEEVCFYIEDATPCRVNNKIYACLHLRAEYGSSAGHIHNITLSIAQCTRLAYFIGYSRRTLYDGDPRNLKFLRFTSKVKSGNTLVFLGEQYTISYQNKHNGDITKKRAGACPMNYGHTCIACDRIHGQFVKEAVTCQGATVHGISSLNSRL